MAEIKVNTNIGLEAVQRVNLQTALQSLETKTEMAPLLQRGANLTVSSASMNLDALVAKLNMETSDTNETTAKMTLGSVLSTVIAHAKENANVTTNNIALLEQAEQATQQMDGINRAINKQAAQVRQYQKAVNDAETVVAHNQKKVDTLTTERTNLQGQLDQVTEQIESLQAQVESLQDLIANETDPDVKENLEQQLNITENKLTKTQKQQANLQKQLNTNATKLQAAQTALEASQATLATAQANLDNANATLDQLNGQQADLSETIQDALDGIQDENILRELNDLLKIDAGDVSHLVEEQKAERSEEEEKYLDTHNPVRVLQDAISHHDQEMLDTIAEKREEKV